MNFATVCGFVCTDIHANVTRLGDVHSALVGVYSDQLKANLPKGRNAKLRVLASSATPRSTEISQATDTGESDMKNLTVAATTVAGLVFSDAVLPIR